MSAMDSSVVVSGRNSAVPHYNPQSGGIQGRIYNPVGVGGGDNVAVRSSSTTSSSYSTDQPSLVQNQMNSSSSNVMNNTNTNSLNHASVSQQELLTNQFSAMAMAASGANSIRIKAAFNGNVYISSIEYNYSIEELVDHIQSICGIQSNNISESSSASSPSSTDATSGQNGKANVRNSLLCEYIDNFNICLTMASDADFFGQSLTQLILFNLIKNLIQEIFLFEVIGYALLIKFGSHILVTPVVLNDRDWQIN